MAEVVYSDRSLQDLDRLTNFLLEADPASAPPTAALITEAIQLLANHPLIGRPAEEGMREVLISRRRSGCIALYSYEEAEGAVLILSVRHQREAGYLDS